MSTHGSPTTRRFVRTAWIMLVFQLFAAAGAVGAAVWAFTAVRNVVNERSMLQARVTELEAAQNQAAPAEPPPAPPVNQVAEEPAPPVEVAPTPAPTPGPPTPAPPVNRPPVARPPVNRPPVYTPPADNPPPYTPPPYTPPRDDKPTYNPPRDDPPYRPERPRDRPRVNIPGIINGFFGDRPRRPQRPSNNNPSNNNPTGTSNPNNNRPPSTNGNNSRPPATYVPGAQQAQPPRTTNTVPVRRPRPRPQSTTQPDQPVVR